MLLWRQLRLYNWPHFHKWYHVCYPFYNIEFTPLLYLQAIDVWMSCCLVFVFMAFVEYLFVNILMRNMHTKYYAPNVDADKSENVIVQEKQLNKQVIHVQCQIRMHPKCTRYCLSTHNNIWRCIIYDYVLNIYTFYF